MSLPDNHNDLIEATVLAYDPDTLTITASYVAPPCLSSPRGAVQGGFVAGFLDHAMGAAYFRASGERASGLNLEISMVLLRPVLIGPLRGKGRVVKMGKRVIYLAGELYDIDGELLATATSTAIPTPVPGRG